eukprot:690720-Alexandrium_andersonii.AAC.1
MRPGGSPAGRQGAPVAGAAPVAPTPPPTSVEPVAREGLGAAGRACGPASSAGGPPGEPSCQASTLA